MTLRQRLQREQFERELSKARLEARKQKLARLEEVASPRTSSHWDELLHPQTESLIVSQVRQIQKTLSRLHPVTFSLLIALGVGSLILNLLLLLTR